MMLLIVVAIATGARGRLAAEPESNLLTLRAPDAEQPVYLNGDSRLTLLLRQEQMAQRAAGYQAFLSFDLAKLRFVAGEYTGAPYGMWILVPIVASGGDLDLASGILPSHQLPSDETAHLASLVFEPVGVEGAGSVVVRNNSPPTRFTNDQGEPLDTHTLDCPTIIIDTTPPTIGCPPDITTPNDVGHPYAAVSVEAPPATDSLSGVESVVSASAATVGRSTIPILWGTRPSDGLPGIGQATPQSARKPST